jgi:hypothetical protein
MERYMKVSNVQWGSTYATLRAARSGGCLAKGDGLIEGSDERLGSGVGVSVQQCSDGLETAQQDTDDRRALGILEDGAKGSKEVAGSDISGGGAGGGGAAALEAIVELQSSGDPCDEYLEVGNGEDLKNRQSGLDDAHGLFNTRVAYEGINYAANAANAQLALGAAQAAAGARSSEALDKGKGSVHVADEG